MRESTGPWRRNRAGGERKGATESIGRGETEASRFEQDRPRQERHETWFPAACMEIDRGKREGKRELDAFRKRERGGKRNSTRSAITTSAQVLLVPLSGI